MAAPKKRTNATSTARKAATGAAKSAARSAAKGAGRAAAKGAAKGTKKAVAAGGERIGRGTRWTEQQVALLLETVASSATAKEAFEVVARQIDKSAGTVAQKYYNLQKASGTPRSSRTRRGRPPRAASGTATRATQARSGGLPTAAELRALTVDDLTGLAMRVKTEIDRRRSELDAASKALKG